VTGAGGFLGGAVAAAFASERPVVAIARRPVNISGVNSIIADLTNTTPPSLDLEGAIVLHAAALMGTQDRSALWAANVDATRRVADWAVSQKASHFIFVSSGGLYPYERGRYWLETDPVKPIGYYGHTKYLAEELLRTYHALDGLTVTVLRLFFPYGPGQTRGIVPFIAKAVREGTELTIQGPGEPRMNPIHVDDCVDAIRRLLTAASGYRIYNLAGDRTVSFLDLVRAAETESGRQARLKHNPTGPGDLLGSIDLLKRDTGWIPQHTIPAG
jgi:nucleoside-diphosphate-sugar epimerase